METVYLSLGANIGDRAQNIARAIEALMLRGVRVTRRSSIYETEPFEMTSQNWFLNSAVEAETDLTPEQLMRALLEIERQLGRERRVARADRPIDIDILLYGSLIVHSDEVQIPHPRMAERRFVLLPLAEIAPEAAHPVLKKTIAHLLAATSDRSQIRILQNE